MIYLQGKPYQIKIGCLTGCRKMHFMNCKSWKEGNIFTTTTLAECLTKRPAYFHVLPVPFIFQLKATTIFYLPHDPRGST